jgi:hypothetical protein
VALVAEKGRVGITPPRNIPVPISSVVLFFFFSTIYIINTVPFCLFFIFKKVGFGPFLLDAVLWIRDIMVRI